MVARHFDSYTEARNQLRRVLDAAHQGLITIVTRDNERFVVSSAEARSAELRRLLPSSTVVAQEGGGWAAFLPGVPVHGDAGSFDGAIADLVAALREYAEDWNDRLHAARNHVQHRSLVELVELSDDEQLRNWLVATEQPAEATAGVPALA